MTSALEEPTVDYINLPEAGAQRSCGATPPGPPGGKVYRLVAVSFGLLCVLQVVLNISLRFTLYAKMSDTEASCKNRTEQNEQKKPRTIDFDLYFQQGWVFFNYSFYYISSTNKSWNESREDCLQRGADLIVVDSSGEQDFARKVQKTMWIGLTDIEAEGMWKWVDGTPLTESYWRTGEPNNFGEEDCVELQVRDDRNCWNDAVCGNQNFWICEKTI